jgi:hypothetical protein
MTRRYKIFAVIAGLYVFAWLGSKFTGLFSELLLFPNEVGELAIFLFGLIGLSVLFDWLYTFFGNNKFVWRAEHNICLFLLVLVLALWVNSNGFSLNSLLIATVISVIGIGAIIAGIYRVIRYFLTNNSSVMYGWARKYVIFLVVACLYGLFWFAVNSVGSVGEATDFLHFLVEAGVVERSSTGMCTTGMPPTCYSKISLSSVFQPQIFTAGFLFGFSVLLDWIYTFFTSNKLSWGSEHTLYSVLIASYLIWILHTGFSIALELVLGGFAVIGIGAIVIDVYKMFRHLLINEH